MRNQNLQIAQTPPHVDKLKQDYEVEYEKFNTGVLSTMKTEELRSLQQTHFEKGTACVNQAQICFKHVSLISKILLERSFKK